MASRKIVLVTGNNKGIGYGIIESLLLIYILSFSYKINYISKIFIIYTFNIRY